MYRFHLSPADLAEVRFAVDPLWECVASVRVLMDPGRHAIHYPWVVEAARAVRGLNLEPLQLFVRGGWCPPHSIAPPPDEPNPEFLAQTDRLRRVPRELIRGDVRWLYPDRDIMPTAISRFLRDTDNAVDELIELLHEYWRRAVEPHWTRFAAVLEGDILVRARLLASHGARGLLQDLHPQIAFASDVVELSNAEGERDVRLEGRGLLLVPSVFAWPQVSVATDPAWRPTLRYPARGIADLWFREVTPENGAPQALEELLGAPRSRLLRMLTNPMSTTEVAPRLGTTPGAASQHLTALTRAGMLDRVRIGRRVFYVRSARAQRVMDALEDHAVGESAGAQRARPDSHGHRPPNA